MASGQKLWKFSSSELKDMKVVDFIKLLNIEDMRDIIDLGQESVSVRLSHTLDDKEAIRVNYYDLQRIRDNLEYLRLIHHQLERFNEEPKRQTPEETIATLVAKLGEQMRTQTKGSICRNTTIDFNIHADGRVTVVMTAETHDGRSFWLSETK